MADPGLARRSRNARRHGLPSRVFISHVLAATGLLLARHATASPTKHLANSQNEVLAERIQSPLDLDWDAPPECPSRDAVRAEILRLTGPPLERVRHLRARVVIRPAADAGWTLTATTDLDDTTGERALSGISCESLSEAAALTLALILNPDLAVSAPEPRLARQDLPPSTGAAAAPASERRTAPLLWRLAAHAGVQTGVIEKTSGAFSLSLGVSRGRLSILLMPSLTPPEDVLVSNEPRLGGRLWLGALAGLGCWAADIGPIALGPCLGLEGSMLRGRGLGVLHPRDTTAYWASAELALFAGVPIGHGLLIELTGVALLPFRRPTVYLDEIGPVSRPNAVGLRALGGLAWVFE
jgi:hypothetical protein